MLSSPILRNLHTPNWFICNEYKSLDGYGTIPASKVKRYGIKKKLVKSLIWEHVLQNILAAENSFVIHIINTIYN